MIRLGGLVTLKPINEAEYTHIGYGKYKEKGKEKDPQAVTYQKDDNGKFTPISSHAAAAKGGDSSAGEDKPKVNIFDKPKKDKKDKSSSSEPDYDKYTNKSQTMTDFFKGDLSIDDLQKVAKKNFDSEIATERDLDGFLNNKFMQDVMADEHDVDKDTLISKVKDLKKALFGGEKEEPSKEEPKKDSGRPKDSTGGRAGNPEVNKAVRKKAASLGITSKKLGKEEYESRMSKAAVEALTDANFHSEARKLIAVLEDKPEWANDPRKDPKMPDIMSPEYEKWQKTSVYSSTFYDSAEGTDELAHAATSESGWDGVSALDAIAFDLKMSGSKKLAAKIQGIIDDTNESTTSIADMIPESVQINEGTRSQVGLIDGSGKIISAYVHYDGYPENMKPGLKKHMKDAKDVLTLIKKGGARGIFDDKEIEYYKSGTPMKGDSKDIAGYIKDADMKNGAEFVYLYNTKDKKWYYADTYKDTKLKKLY